MATRSGASSCARTPTTDIAWPGQALTDAVTTLGPIPIEARGQRMGLVAERTAAASARRAAAPMRKACPPAPRCEAPGLTPARGRRPEAGHTEEEIYAMTASQPRTHWTVEHPGAPARLVVAARSEDKARSLAWRRWYGREPTTAFDERIRAAFSVTDSGGPAE